MIASAEGLRRFREAVSRPHLPETTGVAVALFNTRGQLGLIHELAEQRDGIPIETIKITASGRREKKIKTLLGAMAEVVDDQLVRVEGQRFRWPIQYPQRYDPEITTENGVKLVGSLYVVKFDGDPEIELQPTAAHEVAWAGWHDPEEVLFSPPSGRLRPAAALPITIINTSELFHQFRNAPATPLFSRNFSMSEFYAKREELSDIPI